MILNFFWVVHFTKSWPYRKWPFYQFRKVPIEHLQRVWIADRDIHSSGQLTRPIIRLHNLLRPFPANFWTLGLSLLRYSIWHVKAILYCKSSCIDSWLSLISSACGGRRKSSVQNVTSLYSCLQSIFLLTPKLIPTEYELPSLPIICQRSRPHGYLGHIKEYVISLYSSINRRHSHSTSASSHLQIFGCLMVVLRICVASAVFQPYRDLKAEDNQSLKFEWRGRESNPGPFAPHAKSLTTRPPPLPSNILRIPIFATVLMGTIICKAGAQWQLFLLIYFC